MPVCSQLAIFLVPRLAGAAQAKRPGPILATPEIKVA